MILCVLASFNPFPFLGIETPAWAAWMLENKIYACMMTFFLFNGAFVKTIKSPEITLFFLQLLRLSLSVRGPLRLH